MNTLDLSELLDEEILIEFKGGDGGCGPSHSCGGGR